MKRNWKYKFLVDKHCEYIVRKDTGGGAIVCNVCKEVAIAELTFRNGLQQYVCKEHLEEMLEEGNCEQRKEEGR